MARVSLCEGEKPAAGITRYEAKLVDCVVELCQLRFGVYFSFEVIKKFLRTPSKVKRGNFSRWGISESTILLSVYPAGQSL